MSDDVFITKIKAAHELALEISKNKQLADRIEALEAALHDILDVCWLPDDVVKIARAALAPEQDK